MSAAPVPGQSAVVIASNRGPLAVVPGKSGGDDFHRGHGGLVSGMQEALRTTPDAVWVCAAMNERERAMVGRAAGRRLSTMPGAAAVLAEGLDVRMLPIDPLTFRDSYHGISNATLWFVLHMLFDPTRTPVFDQAWRRSWQSYRRYNRVFAEAMAAEASEGGAVLIQDYHLFLAPLLLRRLRPDLRIAHFTHTPWVSPEYFRMLPDDVARDLLEGLLDTDLLGFHTHRWAGLFADCCRDVLGHETSTVVDVFPLGVDAGDLVGQAHCGQVSRSLRRLRTMIGDRKVIGRVDRVELSKNLPRGLLAYRELLRNRPEWRGRVVHVVCDYPSRQDLPEYRLYAAEVERIGREINDEFGDNGWTPLLLELRDDYPGALATLRLSDVLFVNSIRDGMNLAVLEGIVLSERDPSVVLSRETGAATTLGEDALLVNPFDVSQTAAALHRALCMPEQERAARIGRMRAAAVRLPPAAWLHAQLERMGPDR